MARILIIAGLDVSLVLFRRELIQDWVTSGHTVIAAAPGYGVVSEMTGLGVSYRSIPLRRAGLNPLQDAWLLGSLIRLLHEVKPDYMFVYTIKPVIYGSLAALFWRRCRVYSMITGLGYVFLATGNRQKLLQKAVIGLYKAALRRNDKVFFQNRDDVAEFIQRRIISEDKVVLVRGSGVNIDHYSYQPPPTGPVTFLLISRLLREKGVCEYIEAAKIVKAKYPQAVFRLIGWELEEGPSALSMTSIAARCGEDVVEIYGHTADVRPQLAAASVYVLPSYREGTPRSVLEAMATGRPVITTDAPGCRETVVSGVNGYLVPIQDSQALAEAMELFLRYPEQIAGMGAQSRRICEEKFDVVKVNRTINCTMGLY